MSSKAFSETYGGTVPENCERYFVPAATDVPARTHAPDRAHGRPTADVF